MVISISFIQALFGFPCTAITNSEYMAKQLVAQIESNKTAITLGQFANLATQSIELVDSAVKYDPTIIAIFKSKTDPEIQILATKGLMATYEDRLYASLFHHALSHKGLALFALICREPFKEHALIINHLVSYVEGAIKNGKLDLVRLSLDVKAHGKLFKDNQYDMGSLLLWDQILRTK